MEEDMTTYVATRKINLGQYEDAQILEGDVIEYDGQGTAIIGGKEYTGLSSLRSAINMDWLVKEGEEVSQQGRASAGIEMSAPTPQGNASVADGDSTMGYNEQVVGNVNAQHGNPGDQSSKPQGITPAAMAGQTNRNPNQNRAAQRSQQYPTEAQDAQEVDGVNFATEAGRQRSPQKVSSTSTNPEANEAVRKRHQQARQSHKQGLEKNGRWIENAPNQPGLEADQVPESAKAEGSSEAEKLRAELEQKKQRLEELESSQTQASQGAQSHSSGVTFNNEGISNEAAESGGASSTPEGDQNVWDPQNQEVSAASDVQFDGDNSVEPPEDVEVEIPDDYDLEKREDRLDLLKNVIPDLSWDFSTPWRSKLKILSNEDEFSDPQKVRAIHAAESEAMKKQIADKFPEIFE